MLGAEVWVIVETEINFMCGLSERVEIMEYVVGAVFWIRRANMLRHLHA